MKLLMRFFAIILACTLLFVACGDKIDDAFDDEPEYIEVSGVLTEQKGSDEHKGTHLLTSLDGDITPLNSLTFNLSNSIYLGNEVEVVGVFNEEDGVLAVTEIEVVSVVENDVDEPEFIVYKNTDFGLQLKYYGDWDVEESDMQVVFASPPDDSDASDEIIIQQIPFQYTPTIDADGEVDTALSAYLAANYPDIQYSDELVNKLGIDRVDALKLTNSDGNLFFILHRAGLIYEITYVSGSSNWEKNEDIFYEMILEFKFTAFTIDIAEADAGAVDHLDSDIDVENSDDLDEDISTENSEVILPILEMDFSSFESLPYSFEAKYPSQWYYSGSIGQDDVLHHYGFSDEVDGDELIFMEIMNPSSSSVSSLDLTIGSPLKLEKGDNIEFYLKTDDNIFRMRGGSSYADIMLTMIHSINSIELEE